MRVRVLWALPFGVAIAACNLSGGNGPTGAVPPTEDAGLDGGFPDEPPAHASCSGAATSCLSGTATTKSVATPQRYVANLYDTFPLSGTAPVVAQEVAQDGTWAFSGVSNGTHYYVYVVAVYGEAPDGGGGTSIAANVGPLTVPSSGASVDVVVQPVQLTVLESSNAGGPLDLQSALAYTFDPATGAPSGGNDTVSIVVGGTSVPMPWTAISPSQHAYYATFTTPTAAQSTYTITTSSGPYGLVATAPTFTPSITSPANGATVPAGQTLDVTWTAEAAADDELLYVYTQGSGGTWAAENVASEPLAPGVAQGILPASAIVAGPLLVSTAFVVGSCPASAGGCVLSEAVASSQITAQ
jgi:hypothetical protein